MEGVLAKAVKTEELPQSSAQPDFDFKLSQIYKADELNDRVYGAKKNTNPFANARDEEPEFVEWGYGGMGSVTGAKSADVGNNWHRSQGGSAMGTHDKSRLHTQ